MKRSMAHSLLITFLTWFGASHHVAYAAQNPSSEKPTQEKAIESISLEEEEKETSHKLTQLLTIFLDNTEAAPGATNSAITSPFLNALYDKAGPIIASTSLLYNLINGSFTRHNSYVATRFKKDFHDGTYWTLDNPEQWVMKKITEHLIILIPVTYLKEKNISLNQIGLNISEATSITTDYIQKRYSTLSPSDWHELQNKTGTLFMDALTDNCIFDLCNKNIDWVIYLNGHGEYQQCIASISLEKFALMLHYFNTKIDVALCVYNSCYGAGFNAATIYGELYKAMYKPKNTGERKLKQTHDQHMIHDIQNNTQHMLSDIANVAYQEYSFPIVTEAITDAPTTVTAPGGIKNKQKITFPYNFKHFIDDFTANKFTANKHSYEDSLIHIMPHIKAYQLEKNRNFEDKTNLPQIRYAHSPEWFPLIESTPSVMRITNTIALTRQEPLIVGASILKKPTLPDKIPTKKKPYIHTVLLNTNYIPFDIVITKEAIPRFIITLPGDAKIQLKKLILEGSDNLLDPDTVHDFLYMMNLQKETSSEYKGNKQLYIAELVITSSDIENPPMVYNTVVIDYPHNTLYYTDIHNKQWIIKNNNYKQTIPYPHDYTSQFTELLYMQQTHKENQLLRSLVLQKLPLYIRMQQIHKENQYLQSLALQKLPLYIGKETMPVHTIETYEQSLANIEEQEKTLQSNKEINNALKKTVLNSTQQDEESKETMTEIATCIQQRANVNNYDENGHTLLMHCGLPLEVVKYLLDQEASVNARDKKGNTPFLIAVKNNNAAIIQEMLRYNPDLLINNAIGETIFPYYGNTKIKNLLTNAFQTTIGSIQDSMVSYAHLLELYLQELQTMKKNPEPTQEDIIKATNIKKIFNDFLQWPAKAQLKLNKIMLKTKSIVDTIENIPNFPPHTKKNILYNYDIFKKTIYNWSENITDHERIIDQFMYYSNEIENYYETFKLTQ